MKLLGRSVIPIRFSVALVVAGLAPQLLGNDARCQDTVHEALVEHIAGQNLYLNIGKGVGVFAGDTLVVEGGTNAPRRLLVLSSTLKRSVVEFSGIPFPVTRGAKLLVRVRAAPSTPNEPVSPAPKLQAEERPSLVRSTANRSQRTRQRIPEIQGRLILRFSSVSSATPSSVSSGGGSQRRSFSTPSGGLRASVSHLPGDARAEINLRGSYRYSSSSIVQPVQSMHLYRLAVTKRFEHVPVSGQLGRFDSPHDVAGGYWDGVMLTLGRRRIRGGIQAGYEPDRFNERFTTDLPKYGGFFGYSTAGRIRSSADFGVSQTRPTSDLAAFTSMMMSHDLRASRMRMDTDLQLVRAGDAGDWVVSRFLARATVPVMANVTSTLRYSVRQPFAYWRPGAIVGDRRDQVGGSVTARAGRIELGTSVSFNETNRQQSGRSFSSSLRLLPGGRDHISMGLSSTYWTSDGLEARFLSTTLAKNWGSVRTSTGYTYYQSDVGGSKLQSHSLLASLSVPLLQRMQFSIQGRSQFGDRLSSTSVNASMWVRF